MTTLYRTTAIPIVSIVGKSNSGKTTLLEKLVAELKRRNYKVATAKHHVHADFDIDYPGKDSWRHFQAGADVTLVSSPVKLAMVRRQDRDAPLSELAALVADADILLTEGYRWETAPKVEIVRGERSQTPICEPDELIALVTDLSLDYPVPHFVLDDVIGLADLIESRFLKTGDDKTRSK